jgi:uncharacterized protein YdbL (DUF1318 family)
MSNPSRFSRPSRRVLLALAAAATLLLPACRGALAQSRTLDAPRAAGTVGERYDGYAVVHDPASAASLAPLVDQVNAERRKVYAQRAASDGVPAEQVGRIYAGEIFKSAPSGTWFLQESGQWTKK